jgi:hypothetical protein
MSELEQLKNRIDDAGKDGVLTEHVRDDYEPAGQMMIQGLCNTGQYIQSKGMGNGCDQEWRIFKSEFAPY